MNCLALNLFLFLQISFSCLVNVQNHMEVRLQQWGQRQSSQVSSGPFASVLFAVVSCVQWCNLPTHTGGGYTTAVSETTLSEHWAERAGLTSITSFASVSFFCCALIKRVTGWQLGKPGCAVCNPLMSCCIIRGCWRSKLWQQLSLAAIWSSRRVRSCLVRLYPDTPTVLPHMTNLQSGLLHL